MIWGVCCLAATWPTAPPPEHWSIISTASQGCILTLDKLAEDPLPPAFPFPYLFLCDLSSVSVFLFAHHLFLSLAFFIF